MTAFDSLSPKRCAGNCHNKPLIRSYAWRGQRMGLRDFARHIERSHEFRGRYPLPTCALLGGSNTTVTRRFPQAGHITALPAFPVGSSVPSWLPAS
jgi:hypothetical protein